MLKKDGILDLRQKLTGFDTKRKEGIITITRIFVDGFRNISNTTIRLTEPVTVLLAPNNFGKTNVLHAIEFAAALVSRGMEAQAQLLSENGYTSYNIFDHSSSSKADKEFSFEIEFMLDDESGRKITYSFQISPKAGVRSEVLKCGTIKLFDRKGGIAEVEGKKVVLREHLLLVSLLSAPEMEVTEYAELVRRLFFRMANMFCNRESPHGNFSPQRPVDLTLEVIRLFHNSTSQYREFRDAFLKLFRNVGIENFAIYGLSNRSKDKVPDNYRAEDYRLEFTTAGKKRRELYSNLSTGTQDVFSLLLEVFSKQEKPLVVIEEIENGIHPSLYRNILKVIDGVCKNTRVLVTTHSPSVVRHFEQKSFSSFYVGVPERDSGRATFAAFDDSKRTLIEERASRHGASIGELIMDMLSDTNTSSDELKGWLRA
jgi:predicted ATPase